MISFIDSIHDESEDPENASSYLDYTSQWIKKINRGGLFLIGDNVYEIFHAIGVVHRAYLKTLNSPLQDTADIDALILSITQDDDVQFWWALVCASLDNDLAEMLLQKIAQLWITIRGYSYASSIVEQYK